MELRGKVINVVNFYDPEVFYARIVDADPDIGFTLVDASNKDLYIYCYHGDSSVCVKENPSLADPEADKFMWEYLNDVANGKIFAFDENRLNEWCEDTGRSCMTGGDPSSENCAFGS